MRSDLGYYNDQYGSGSVKNGGSESGRSHRRPLQQGRDGFDQWERYSQRSVGDGYASDVEGFNYAGMIFCQYNYGLVSCSCSNICFPH